MSKTFTLILPDLEATFLLGKTLSQYIVSQELHHIFMTGELGSGKTTLTHAIVTNLPNAHDCEVASPSFSLINYYPTQPEIQHADLYRCQDNIPDELLDNLENPHMVTLLEWSEFLPPAFWPAEVLQLKFEHDLSSPLARRRLTLEAFGTKTWQVLASLEKHFAAS